MAKPFKINLALQGGGAHGAVTWGVLQRLLEDDRLELEAISGSSAGAVNAVALAYGLHKNGRDGAMETLEQLWRRVSDAGSVYSPVNTAPSDVFGLSAIANALTYQMFETMTRSFSPYQFNPFNINPLKDILEDIIEFDALRRCKVTKLFLAATNVRSGKVKVFETKDVSADVVGASACLPFLFKAVEVDGEHYWDGGYMGNPVLFPFFYEASSADVMIVHVNPIERDDLPVTPSAIMNRINEISFNSSLLRELRAISFVHRLLDDGWLKETHRDRLRDVRIHSIRSDEALVEFDNVSKFRIDWPFLTDLKKRGYDIADAWLKENCTKIGKESSVDLRAMFE
ncbi:MAG: patatin-like phospholipase family protein [Parvularculaceae bacterium]|nr:patatin-like phospholipase family protein [Parvularculaceae bacterium]